MVRGSVMGRKGQAAMCSGVGMRVCRSVLRSNAYPPSVGCAGSHIWEKQRDGDEGMCVWEGMGGGRLGGVYS